eukprot:81061-Prymnesium_polylepis.1
MSQKPLAQKLRPRPSLSNELPEAVPVRDRAAERRRALSKATQAAIKEQEPQRTLVLTKFAKGEASTAYEELSQAKPLPIVLKSPSSAVVTDSQRQRRLAIASRWFKARKAAALAAGQSAPPPPTSSLALAGPVQARAPRRGEIGH